MKDRRNRIIFLLICFLTLSTLALTGSHSAYASESELMKRTISVSGAYTVKAAPDIAYINIAVNTFDVDAEKAQEKNKINMNKVMGKLTSLGIEDKDIQTVDYRIQPRYEWKNVETKNGQGEIETKRVQILLGYDCMNTIKVTVNDFQKIGSIIDITVKEGINEVNNIAFSLSEAAKNQKYLEALKGAVENGKRKAEFIASIYGISLTTPAVINESGINMPSPIIYNGLETISKATESYGIAEGTPISGGEMEISANVMIVYQY